MSLSQKQASPDSQSDLVTKSEAARQLGGDCPLSISCINALLAKKKLAKVRLSYRNVRIPQSSITAFINARTVEASK